jgi:CheY-like chemotaxis protein
MIYYKCGKHFIGHYMGDLEKHRGVDKTMQHLILIVDDNACVRQCVATMIEADGHATLEAAGASGALSLLERHPAISLLFTDIVMPVINGFVLADMAVARWPQLRVIYASGLSDPRDAGEQAGYLHGPILRKPFRSAELSSAIAAALAMPAREQQRSQGWKRTAGNKLNRSWARLLAA